MTEQDSQISLLPLYESSVDDLFQKNLVRLIQKLYSDYVSQVNQAKLDLHTLVGQKYRELIRIAEEVDSMNSQSSQIDAQLTDLSYRRSNHVQFGSSASARFDAKTRAARAKQARNSQQTTILNNIINTKIIGFDLKLKSNTVPSTAAIVRLAKLYFTVSCVFKETLEAQQRVLLNFLRLRSNFVSYLEQRIASYNVNVSAGDLSLSNILLRPPNTWIEVSARHFFDQLFIDDELEELEDWDQEGLFSEGTSFAPQSLPIVNLLLAYVIVNGEISDVDSTGKLAQRVIDLRYKYFSSRLDTLLASEPNRLYETNFFAIFTFFENTCFIVRDCLIGEGFSDMQFRLSALKAWNPVDLLGFHNWLDTRLVSFDKDKYTALPHDFWMSNMSLLAPFVLHLRKYMSQIVSRIDEEEDLAAIQKVQVLFNSIAALCKVELLTSQMDVESIVVDVFSKEQLLPQLLVEILLSIKDHVIKHQNKLPMEIMPLLQTTPAAASSIGPFTLDFVGMIDIDVAQYIDGVTEVAALYDTLQARTSDNSISGELRRWFATQRNLLGLVSCDSEVRKRLQNIMEKTQSDNLQLQLWGDFTSDALQHQFDELGLTLKQFLLEKLFNFGTALLTRFNALPNTSEAEVYFTLNLILILRKNLSVLDLPESGIHVELDKEVLSIYQKLFEFLESGYTLLSPIRTMTNPVICNSSDDGILPSGPHMLVYSMMNQLASRMLEFDSSSASELYLLFLDESLKEKYVEAKNRWIEQLVDQLDVSNFAKKRNHELQIVSKAANSKIKTSKTKKTGEIEEPDEVTVNDFDWTDGAFDQASDPSSNDKTISTSEVICNSLLVAQTRQLFANGAFLLLFTGDQVAITNPNIARLVQKLKRTGAADSLEDSVAENILRGVSSYYQAGKETYVPLLLN